MSFKLELVFLVLVVLAAVADAAEQHWHYVPDDPNQWTDMFPACAGKSQSPIDIQSSMSVFNSTLQPIVFKNYDVTYLFNFTNNGHTIVSNQFRDDITGLMPYITGSNFGSEMFFLQQFHFHWGSSPKSGSEHLMNGKAYAGELHLVHKSASGKFAVVGFFLDINELNNTRIDELLKTVTAGATQDSVKSMYLILTSVLPDLANANANGYFRYMGSLTTPPCTEGIIWTVYRQPIEISAQQMQAFYKNSVLFNNRPVQPLNGRTVYSSVAM